MGQVLNLLCKVLVVLFTLEMLGEGVGWGRGGDSGRVGWWPLFSCVGGSVDKTPKLWLPGRKTRLIQWGTLDITPAL